jgi:hypothetical protein
MPDLTAPAVELADGRGTSPAQWWCATAAGTIVSLPFAWLLSYAAMLPFYLGLFFFMLFGLVIGAVVYRIAAPGRPYGRFAVLTGTTLIVGVCWTLSIVKESRDFPADVAADAVLRSRDIGRRSADEYRTAVAEEVRSFLRERHSPGGVLGYARWMLLEGEIKKGAIPSFDQTLRRSPARIGWAIRVVLSIALLGFAVGSQTLSLSRRSNPVASPAQPILR